MFKIFIKNWGILITVLKPDYTIVSPLFMFSICSFALILKVAIELVLISVELLMVILTAAPLPFSVTVSPSSNFIFPDTLSLGDPGLMLSFEDTDRFWGDVKVGGGGGANGIPVGELCADRGDWVTGCCCGGESRIAVLMGGS